MNDLQRYAPEAARLIALELVHALLSAGFALSVNDGEETTLRGSRDENDIFEALVSTDADTIIAYGGDDVRSGDKGRGFGTEWAGSVLLIWENGEDVISDWSWRAGYRNGDRFNALLSSMID